MNEQQKTQYTAFMANFVLSLAEEHVPYAQAMSASIVASSCLLAIMFEMTPNDDDHAEGFCASVIRTSFQRFYDIPDLSKLN